jgi:hypothetical protein
LWCRPTLVAMEIMVLGDGGLEFESMHGRADGGLASSHSLMFSLTHAILPASIPPTDPRRKQHGWCWPRPRHHLLLDGRYPSRWLGRG